MCFVICTYTTNCVPKKNNRFFIAISLDLMIRHKNSVQIQLNSHRCWCKVINYLKLYFLLFFKQLCSSVCFLSSTIKYTRQIFFCIAFASSIKSEVFLWHARKSRCRCFYSARILFWFLFSAVGVRENKKERSEKKNDFDLIGSEIRILLGYWFSFKKPKYFGGICWIFMAVALGMI